MSQKLIITRGLPASGKTTWAVEYCTNNPRTVRVNRDDIRNMLVENFVHGSKMEELVTIIEHTSIKEALKDNYSVVVDATNLRGYEQFIPLMPKEADIELEIQEFTSSVDECAERDAKRTKGKVGKEIIQKMYDKYCKR